MFRSLTPQRCDQVRQWVALALDGELSPFERTFVDRHLKSCASCERFSSDVGAFTQALRATPLEPLERPVELPSRRSDRLRTLRLAAAAAAAVAVGGMTLGNSLREEERLASRLAEAREGSVDVGSEELRRHQRRQLEERLALIRSRPVGRQLA